MTTTVPEAADRRRTRLRFLGLFVLAAALRLPGLNQGFWFDEIMAVVMFFPAPWSKLLTEMPIANHHPLYSLLGKIVFLLAGEREWALRLPAFLFGSLTPPVLYLAGRRMGERVGLLGAVFMAAGMWPVWFSQDARGYSLMILLSLGSASLFISLLENFSRRAALGCAACGALAIYTHMFAGAVVGAEWLIALVMVGRRRDWRPLATVTAALAVALLLYLPLLGDFIGYTSSQGRIAAGREMGAGFLWSLLVTFSAGRLPVIVGLGFLAPAAAGFALSLRRQPLVPMLFALSLGIGIAVPLILKTFVFHRFLAYALPWTYIFAAVTVDRLFVASRNKLAATLVAIIAISILLPLADYYRKGKQSFRPAAEWIAANAPGYHSLAIGLGRQAYWYYDESSKARIRDELDPSTLDHAAVVVSHWWSVSPREREMLDRYCAPAKEFPSAGYREYDVTVYLCPPKARQ